MRGVRGSWVQVQQQRLGVGQCARALVCTATVHATKFSCPGSSPLGPCCCGGGLFPLLLLLCFEWLHMQLPSSAVCERKSVLSVRMSPITSDYRPCLPTASAEPKPNPQNSAQREGRQPAVPLLLLLRRGLLLLLELGVRVLRLARDAGRRTHHAQVTQVSKPLLEPARVRWGF